MRHLGIVPECISRGDHRVQDRSIPLQDARYNKFFVDDGGDGLSQDHIVKRRFPEIEPHVIQGAFLVVENLDTRFFFEIIEITWLQVPPEHIDVPLFQGQDRHIRRAVEFKQNLIDIRPQ